MLRHIITSLGTLQELGQLDGAIENYEKALILKPDYAEAHNNLGNVLKEFDQLDRAIKCYMRAVAINPDFSEAH